MRCVSIWIQLVVNLQSTESEPFYLNGEIGNEIDILIGLSKLPTIREYYELYCEDNYSV